MATDVREKEQLEYLFLDLEWNQAPGTTGLDGREAIQIGVVAADTKIQKTKTFSKAIRLSDPSLFNEKTQIVTHTPITNIMQGKEENVVLTKFAKHFPDIIILSYGTEILMICSWRYEKIRYFNKKAYTSVSARGSECYYGK